MAVFIALLRGINVGKSHRIPMADLVRSLTAAGLSGVETYIQSGNVVFESGWDEDSLRSRIEDTLQRDFGLSSPVVLCTARELNELVSGCPFTPQEIAAAHAANTEGESLYVLLPVRDAVPPGEHTLDGDTARPCGRGVWLLLCRSIRRSRLAAQLEKSTAPCTIRSGKTLAALLTLAAVRPSGGNP